MIVSVLVGAGPMRPRRWGYVRHAAHMGGAAGAGVRAFWFLPWPTIRADTSRG
jgi:hypothetical protein